MVPYFEDGKHPSHCDSAEWSISSHHREGIYGSLHMLSMFCMLRHTVLANGHISRKEFLDFFFHARLINTEHNRQVVTHRIHRMVTAMAMHGPVSHVSDKLNIACLAGCYQYCCFRPLCGGRNIASIRRDHLKRMAMQMDRMSLLCNVGKTDANAIPCSSDKGFCAWKGTTVECKNVKIRHHIDIRGRASGFNEPFT